MRSKFASVLMAFLLVTSGMAGSATAATSSDTCSELDKFIDRAISLATFGLGEGTQCGLSANEAIDEMQQSDANQTKVDIYNAGAAEVGEVDTFGSTYDNYLNDSESVAWMKMQVAVAEAYQNGSTKTVAVSKARQAISDYYAVKQINLIEQWNTTASNLDYLHQTAANETDISSKFVYAPSPNLGGGSRGGYAGYQGTSTVNLDLVNGSTRSSLALDYGIESIETSLTTKTATIHPDSGTVEKTGDNNNGGRVSETVIKAPDSNYDPLTVVTYEDYDDRMDKIRTLNTNLQAEAESFVNATYADFDAGVINASDVISANTAMFEYGTSDGSSLYDSTAALAMMGFDTPNMTNSGTMDVNYNGRTYTGILLARNAPNGSWQTGETYNTSNIDGPVFVATTDGKKIDLAEGETFGVHEIRSQSGSNVTQVNTTKYVYKTANTSELTEMQSQLVELRKEVESREPSGGGGSGSGLNEQTLLAIAAVAGAALLLGGRSN